MSNRTGVREDLVVVSSRGGLIAKEVNLVEPFVLNSAECVCLVPTVRKDVERDLSTDGKRQAIVGELLFKDLNEFYAVTVLLVYSFKLVAFLNSCIATNGTNVDHSPTEFNKGSALDRNVHVSDVMKNEVDEGFVTVFPNKLYERLGRKRLSAFERREPVLRKGIIKVIDYTTSGGLELFGDLDKIRAADEPNDNPLA